MCPRRHFWCLRPRPRGPLACSFLPELLLPQLDVRLTRDTSGDERAETERKSTFRGWVAAGGGDSKMHTLWVRLNAVVFFGLTVIVCLAVLTWFSTATHRGFPTVETLKMNKLTSLRSHGNKDIAVLTFDLHADLEKAFNWNVKQLFVFVVAEYRSKKHPLNQVVVWDTIIEHKEDAKLHLDKQRVDYGLIDQGTELRWVGHGAVFDVWCPHGWQGEDSSARARLSASLQLGPKTPWRFAASPTTHSSPPTTRNTTVTLKLVWDHMPLTGRLFMESLPASQFKLPGGSASTTRARLPNAAAGTAALRPCSTDVSFDHAPTAVPTSKPHAPRRQVPVARPSECAAVGSARVQAAGAAIKRRLRGGRGRFRSPAVALAGVVLHARSCRPPRRDPRSTSRQPARTLACCFAPHPPLAE